ncbi:MAG: S9 family peptidase [Thermoplasmatales archaeon]|jgi:dipeptidyl aminopeptidase/acylaminoacyl peptidase|nr:S9 family peptidase [Candidatus Thermoplasmatota archaeon]MDA8055172.1 S9 family peptidase [Thermoplasmatales archaeon]
MSSLKIEDFYDLRFIANLNIANGRTFFEIYRPVEKSNKYESEIFELKGAKTVKFTRGNEDRDAVIDLTGFRMAYLTRVEKKTSVFIKNIETGEERRLWETELTVKKMMWDRLSKGLYIIAQDKPKDDDFRILEKYPMYFNGEGFFPTINYQFLHLRLNGKVQKILELDGEMSDFAVNPSRQEVAIVERPDNWDVYDSRIRIIDPLSKESNYIPGVRGGVSSPVYDGDGNLYFLFSKQERSIFESPKLFRYKNRKIENLLEEYDISPENSVNSDSRMGITKRMIPRGGYIYFIATVEGRAGIYRVGENKRMEGVVKGDFSVDSFDFDGDRIYYVAQFSNVPQEIYQFNGQSRRITIINSRLERRTLRSAKNFRMKASDGKEIEGWFLGGQKRGTILEIHGGPRTSYGEAFTFEFHLINSLGFNVLYSNPRGSDSYGDDFALEIKEHYGERDYQDILEIIDYASSRLGVKKEKIGIIGGSYGGFMVNWMVGHTDQFKAAVADRSISDQISFYFSSDIGPRFNSDQMGGNPYDNLEHFWGKSPLKYIKNVKTPLLIVHSDEDYRCPIWQAYEMFTQLKRQGSVVRMISFKGENHDLSRGGKPKNRVKRLEEITKWFESKMS